MPDPNQTQIRQRMAAQRLAMPTSTVSHCAGRFPLHLPSFSPFEEASSVAAYLAVKNEACPANILEHSRELGKITYLPVIVGEILRFAPVDNETVFTKGKFGIPIPDIASSELVEACDLDVIVMPLLAFDSQGHRVGMGGGFYDKTLANVSRQTEKPFLLGLGYEWQHVESLKPNPWDVPLHAALTESALHDFRS